LQRDLPRIAGGRVQLQQVLLNLIMNGIDAMTAIRDRRRVLMLKSDRDDHRVLVTILDSGTGLVADNVDRIFDAFFTTRPDGMGMGLAISWSIAETHGATLWASPLQPHGTAFYLSLPLAQGGEQ
jgi:signal transduction histidine kinase